MSIYLEPDQGDRNVGPDQCWEPATIAQGNWDLITEKAATHALCVYRTWKSSSMGGLDAVFEFDYVDDSENLK